MLSGASASYEERRQNLGKDDPEGFCLPPGVPRVNGVPFPIRSPDAFRGRLPLKHAPPFARSFWTPITPSPRICSPRGWDTRKVDGKATRLS